jgi:hypothetical protein
MKSKLDENTLKKIDDEYERLEATEEVSDEVLEQS